jgi:flagellar L-ring protein precursor FlgH
MSDFATKQSSDRQASALFNRAAGTRPQVPQMLNVRATVAAADRGGRFFVAMASTALLVLAMPLSADAIPHLKLRKTNTAETPTSQYDDYLNRMRSMNPAVPATLGSLWVSSGPLAHISNDYKARNVGDLVVIHLLDNFTAANAGENKTSRQFNTNSAITGLLGKIGARNRLQNLFGANSNTSLDGKGQSSLSSNVQLNFAASVVEVLPNNILVIEAARDITVGNDRQTVILHGLVRPGDLAPDNSIPSTSISNLEIEIKGKGAVADATRQPNIVIRLLLRIFTF